jgi:ATP-dependent exoDNAse (exonuclease V) beta subunit
MPNEYLSSLVTAPAGSGKTTTIVSRYLHELRTGHSPDQVIAITFTRRAAAELVERLEQVLGQFADTGRVGGKNEPCMAAIAGTHIAYPAMTPDVARRALGRLPFAPVTTVDAFTQRLLHEHLVHAAYPLSGDDVVHIDGPLRVVPSGEEFFLDAAHRTLSAACNERDVLLRHLTIGESVRAVARLAQLPSESVLRDAGGNPAGSAYLKETGGAAAGCTERDELRARVAPWLADGPSWDAHWVPKRTRASAAVADADPLRNAAWALSRYARELALRAMAAEGVGTHEELLRAARHLCIRAARGDVPALQDRYRALLVDEVQDTNPDQLQLYDALVALCGDRGRSLYVGDSRQSIYRFRGSDSHGWNEIIARAGLEASESVAALTKNYRSGMALVAFQRELTNVLRSARPGSLESIDSVDSGVVRQDGEPQPTTEPPVTLVLGRKADMPAARAIAAFARRITGGQGPLDAAVLTHTWNQARSAVAELERHGIDAELVGESAMLEARATRDLRTLLRALSDPSDTIAWMGLLKHPSIGIRDGTLVHLVPFSALARSGIPEPARTHLDEHERAALDEALPVLWEAAATLGRRPTAEVLDDVVTRLRWRPIIGAGPEGGEGVADLDVALEAVASRESDGIDPNGVLALLEGREDGAELPGRIYRRSTRTVQVTTIFQSKGLEFDHVCIPFAERAAASGVETRIQPVRVFGCTLLRASVDPDGGLHPQDDPVGMLVATLDSIERRMEAARLLYVAVTRAKKSVTMAVVEPSTAGTRTASGLDARLAAGLQEAAPRCNSIMRLMRADDPTNAAWLAIPKSEARRRAPSRGFVPPTCPPPDSVPGKFVSPSSASSSSGIAADVTSEFRRRAVVERGDVVPAPLPGFRSAYDHATQGDLVHGWIEHWGLRSEPTERMASEYLASRWPTLAPITGLARGLCGLAPVLRGMPRMRQAIDAPGVQLVFEQPILARIGADVISGRIDLLLVDRMRGTARIIDFKAGWGHQADRVDLDSLPSLAEYAEQLGAYAAGVEAAGLRVEGVALVYAGIPAVAWLER